MIAKLRTFAAKFNDDTAGAMSVEKIMILGLIALPILILLLAFRKTIVGWFTGQTNGLQP